MQTSPSTQQCSKPETLQLDLKFSGAILTRVIRTVLVTIYKMPPLCYLLIPYSTGFLPSMIYWPCLDYLLGCSGSPRLNWPIRSYIAQVPVVGAPLASQRGWNSTQGYSEPLLLLTLKASTGTDLANLPSVCSCLLILLALGI